MLFVSPGDESDFEEFQTILNIPMAVHVQQGWSLAILVLSEEKQKKFVPVFFN